MDDQSAFLHKKMRDMIAKQIEDENRKATALYFKNKEMEILRYSGDIFSISKQRAASKEQSRLKRARQETSVHLNAD